MSKTERPVAVVTGANRGLGRETVKQLAAKGYIVILAARDGLKASAAAEAVAAELEAAGHGDAEIIPFKLDVTNSMQAEALAAFIFDRYDRLDVLVNNAGVMLDVRKQPALKSDPAILEACFGVNTIGAFRVARALSVLLRGGGGGAIVNVSSGLGGIQEMGGGNMAYRLSKAALNALTKVLAHELSDDGVRVNSVCPGWVQTDMGGKRARRTVSEGAAGIVWAATLGQDGPSGGFFRDGEPISW